MSATSFICVRARFPELGKVGRIFVKVRIPALILVLLVVVPCYLGQSRADFLYGMGTPDPGVRYSG